VPQINEAYATRNSLPIILHHREVCGGVARVSHTRIPVWSLERMRQLGISASEILGSFPTLRAIDLVQAWKYAEENAKEIAEQIRGNEEV
jgi:uncharacterized protein (DUF433 family)